MTGNEYQNLAMRTNDGLGTERLLDMADNLEQGLTDAMPETDIDLGGLINGLFGLSGESGEFIDMIKNGFFTRRNWTRITQKRNWATLCGM